MALAREGQKVLLETLVGQMTPAVSRSLQGSRGVLGPGRKAGRVLQGRTEIRETQAARAQKGLPGLSGWMDSLEWRGLWEGQERRGRRGLGERRA